MHVGCFEENGGLRLSKSMKMKRGSIMSRRRFIENLEGIVDLIDSGDVIKAMTTLWQI